MAYSLSDAVGGFDNNGEFKRIYNWTADRNAGIKILADRMDNECDNFAQGFNNCITRDGKGKINVDFNFNGHASSNLITRLVDPTSAVNTRALLVDPTRLFYDVSTATTTIILRNEYMQTAAVNAEEGYHFYFSLNNTISTEDMEISFYGSTVLNSMEVLGPDGAKIPVNTLQKDGVYEAIILVNQASSVKYICILNAITVGIESANDYLTSEITDEGAYKLTVNKDAIVAGLSFIKDVSAKSGDNFMDISKDSTDNQKVLVGLKIDDVKTAIGAVLSVDVIENEKCILVDNGDEEHPDPQNPRIGLDLDETYRRFRTDADFLMARNSIWTSATSSYVWGNMTGLQTALDVFGDLIVDGRFPTFTLSGSSTSLNTDLNPVFKFAGKGLTFQLNMVVATDNAWGTIAPQDQGSGTIIFDGGAAKASVKNFTFDNNNGATYILRNIHFSDKESTTIMTKPAIIINDNCTVIVESSCDFSLSQFGALNVFEVNNGTLNAQYNGA